MRGANHADVRANGLGAADALAPGSDIVASGGGLLAQVALVKGLPGPAEAAGGAALSGVDVDLNRTGEALSSGGLPGLIISGLKPADTTSGTASSSQGRCMPRGSP